MANKKLKNKRNKRKKRKNWDKLSFEKREKIRSKLKKERVYTKAFRTEQTFGPASQCRSIDVKKFLEKNPQYEVKDEVK